MTEKPWFLEKDGISFRQWKQTKRAELRALKKALDAYRLGCAYCPRYQHVEDIADEIKQMTDALSVKHWGR